MAEEDEILMRYLSDDERYADLINGAAFGGSRVVAADDLAERDSKTGYHKRTESAKGRRRTKYRDLFRRASFGINFAVIGLENQKQVHYLMPVRCMEYDLKEYQRQIVEQERKRDYAASKKKDRNAEMQERQTPAEYLSGFSKEGKLRPCITFVLYYGDEWDGSKDLHSLMDFDGIPEELKNLTNNYKINLVEIKKLENTEVFHTDLKLVFDFIRYEKDKEKLVQLIENEPEYAHLREDAYDVIAALTKSKDLVQVKTSGKEEQDMCQALEEMKEDARKEQLQENLRALIANLNITAERAMEVLNIPAEERGRYETNL